MIKQDTTNIERIIAKIDNDFNPDNSDWVPRVGVWTLEVMGQLNILNTERAKVQLPVKERINFLKYFPAASKSSCTGITVRRKVTSSN